MREALSSAELLDETRNVIREARTIVGAGEGARFAAGGPGILGAYESLCRMLDDVNPEHLHTLISRIARQLEQLNHLADDVERVRRLRQTMRES